MQILLIHQVFCAVDVAGGTRHYEFARHCIDQGHSFTVVASDVDYYTGQRLTTARKLISSEDVDGIKVLRAYTHPWLQRSFFWRLIAYFVFSLTSFWAALTTGPMDVVMGTSPPIFQTVSAWLVAKLRRRPFLLEIRDLWPQFPIDMGIIKSPLIIAVSRWLERFLYRQATHIIVNSPAYRDHVMANNIPEEKITLISNGVDPDMFEPEGDGAVIRDEFQLGDKFVVTYAGALGMANDIPTLLRAAARLLDRPDIHFLIVGDGKERQNLEALREELKLTNVTFTGVRPKSQMPEFLAASDACVAVLKDTFRTTYPNKVFDYMAAGRPILLVIDGVIREVVEAARCGIFVPSGDDAALASAAKTLCEDPEKARASGRAGRSYVIAHFHRRKQAQHFVKLLERLTGDTKGP